MDTVANKVLKVRYIHEWNCRNCTDTRWTATQNITRKDYGMWLFI